MMSESSPAASSLQCRAAPDDLQVCSDVSSEKPEPQDEHGEAWASVTRRSRGSRVLRGHAPQKRISEMSSCSTEAPNEIESVASIYALLVDGEDDDRNKDSDADGNEERSEAAAPKMDSAAIGRRQKGSKTGKARTRSGQKTAKSPVVVEDEQEWPHDDELVATPKAECLSAEKACALRGTIGRSASAACRSGSATRCSGSAPPSVATMAFAAELLAIVSGIAPERQEVQAPKGRRRAQPRQQQMFAPERPQRSVRSSVRQTLTHARGSRK